MRISMQKGKWWLAGLWFFGGATLFLIMLAQTFMNHYGNDVTEAWAWLLPTIIPTLSLIIGVLVSDAFRKGVKIKTVSRPVFLMSFALSAVYLVVVLMTLAIQPYSPLPPLDLMKISHLWQGPFQGLVSASMGVFFTSKE